MTTVRRFTCSDLLRFNNVNFDPLTETYALSFYMEYLAKWPEYFLVVEAANGDIMGYIMGKSEGHASNWHGHVTAVTVAPEYRRMGIAKELMKSLEDISEKKHCYFVDLYVRASNELAIAMYRRFGYVIYRTVLEYYSSAAPGETDNENGLDMRKALSADVDKRSVVPLKDPVTIYDLDE